MQIPVFAWRNSSELQWKTRRADPVSLLFLLLILQPCNMGSARGSPDVSAALKEDKAQEAVLTGKLVALNPDQVTSRSASTGRTV